MSSSIFSSEKSVPSTKEPVAIFVGVVLLLLLELFVRLIPSEYRIGYTPAIGAYYEVKHQIEAYGSADIAVVGTSRAREGIVMPDLLSVTTKLTEKTPSAANYACAGIRSTEVESLIRLLLSSERKPKLILYLVSPRILKGEETSERFERLFFAPDESNLPENNQFNSLYHFNPIINYLMDHYYTLKHRMRIHALTLSFARGRIPSSPVKGELTTWHRYEADRRLSESGLTAEDARRYVQRLSEKDGTYVLGSSRLRAIERTIENCKKAGVPIVFVEIPLAKMLKDAYPIGLYESFIEKFKVAALNGGVRFYELKQLGINLNDDEFREYSHLNLDGAKRFTIAVVEKVIVPHLK